MDGKIAKTIKGRANASPKANIPIMRPIPPPLAEIPTNRVPRIGPVQEKEAKDKTNARKKMPGIPRPPAILLTLLSQEEGS